MIEIPYNFHGRVQYQKYSEIEKRIKKFSNHSIIGKDASGMYNMYRVELGSRKKPTIMVTSAMHGTEWQATQYSLEFMEMLRDNTFPDTQFREEILYNYHILYLPVLNPWGLDRVTDIYAQFDNTARNTSTGTQLNSDFLEGTEQQQETKNVISQIEKFEPFAGLDMHLFQPDYSPSNGRNIILANAQQETWDIRDKIIESWENYTGEVATVWSNIPGETSGLLRAYLGRQSNPYTPYTLSYISEIVRPAYVNGKFIQPVSDENIYSYGISCIYLFIKTSIDYLQEHWQPEPDIKIKQNPTTRIVVRDQDMKRIGELEKAYNVSVDRRVNELWTASFSLAKNDPKQHLCDHMNYIDIYSPSGRYYGMYRIMPSKTRRSVNDNSITYECEHVLSTLMDDVIDGQLVLTHYSTRYNLQELLDLQTVARWQLGEVEFNRHFNYSFENENSLLAPIFEIPKGFNEPYEYTFDTTVYPWKLNLIRPSDEVTSEIRWSKDMIDFEEVSDPTNIINHIIPKGAGEGVNQLTIDRVNNGVRYLEDNDSIKKWGIKKYIWIDKRYEDPYSLMENAQARLEQWKDPQISFSCKGTDLSVKPEYSHERRLLNGVTRITVEDQEYKARIVAERIPDLNKEWDVDYEVNNKINDIATTQADMERRQQVNESYAQGATNILTFGYQDNADSKIPAVIPFYIDDDVINVNTCELTFRTKPYRAYSRATEGGGSIATTTGGGGGIITSTLGGGGSEQTSSSGGGTRRSTAGGGGTSRSTAGGGGVSKSTAQSGWGSGDRMLTSPRDTGGSGTLDNHVHWVSQSPFNHSHNVTVDPHTHSFTVPSHAHDFEVPSHTHKVEIPNHTHEIELKNHTHRIEIPNHTHEVRHEIIELNELPTSVRIRVDGNTVPHTSIRGDRIDLSNYIDKDSNGRIKRGRHELTILPDRKGRIEADLILRVFIQSQLGRAM